MNHIACGSFDSKPKDIIVWKSLGMYQFSFSSMIYTKLYFVVKLISKIRENLNNFLFMSLKLIILFFFYFECLTFFGMKERKKSTPKNRSMEEGCALHYTLFHTNNYFDNGPFKLYIYFN